MDDFLLFADNKAIVWRWKGLIQERLQQLRLTMHPHAHPYPVEEGIPFLGFIVYPQRRRLKRRKCIHFRRKLRGLLAKVYKGDIPLSKVSASVKGWVNHVRYRNTIGLRKSVLGKLSIGQNRK